MQSTDQVKIRYDKPEKENAENSGGDFLVISVYQDASMLMSICRNLIVKFPLNGKRSFDRKILRLISDE